MASRGVRNNNPGNIRLGSDWQGLSDRQEDKSFCQFVSMPYGIRAIMRILNSYVNMHKLHTVSDIIHRWAPSNENDSKAYSAFVAKALGVTPTTELTKFNKEFFINITKAIVDYENDGSADVITDADYEQAYRLAGL